MTYETDPQPLEIAGSDLELRFHPLPVLAAIDEFADLGAKLDETGALNLLMTSGTGMQLDPRSWDMAEAALVLKALVAASGEGKPSAVMASMCERYGVQRKQGDAWAGVDTSGLNALGPDALFVVFACLKSSFTPFLTRLKSSAGEQAEKSAQHSPASVAVV